jgi:hypothetical protein
MSGSYRNCIVITFTLDETWSQKLQIFKSSIAYQTRQFSAHGLSIF